MSDLNSDLFSKKRDKLSKLRRTLKRKFVGIDDVVDEVVSSIEAWYLMPELLTRPTIINLWGTTGVGKTELVDTIAKELGFSKKYTKIELAGATSRGYSVLELFTSRSNVVSQQQNMIFFDEFQNFRTIDKKGNDIPDKDHTDFWELLNDGKIATKRELKEITDDLKYLMPKKGSSKLVKETWMGSEYELNRVKSVLGLNETLAELGEWSVKKMYRALKRDSQNAFHKLDCTKSLIVIAGNLDEAYRFSEEVDEIDLDADDFHQLSKKVNFLTIKKALTTRFKPEQIARLGNTHIIYPCLDKKAYQRLIKMSISSVRKHLKKMTGIDLTVHKTVLDLIYENGVFPAQGARPVFTTIREVVENNIPRIALFCTDNKASAATMKYSNKEITVQAGKKTLSLPYEGKVHALKERKTEDELTIVAVHEAGHAIMFAKVFGIAPEKIAIDTVSGGKAGFVKNPNIFSSKEFLEKEVMVLLAAQCAEEEIFGTPMVSAGASHDIEVATEIVCKMVRQYGLSSVTGRYGSETDLGSGSIITKSKDETIENVLSEIKTKVKAEVAVCQKVIIKLAELLLERKFLTREEFISFLEDHDIKSSAKEKVYPNYSEVFKAKVEELDET